MDWERRAELQQRIVDCPVATIGDRLRLVRYRKEKKAETAALEMGISETSLIKWERSEYNPRVAELIILAEYYNVSLDWLVLGK